MEFTKSNEKRRFERDANIHAEDGKAMIEVIVDSKSVQLINFSIGGLYVLSDKHFSNDKVVKLSIEQKDKGKIDLMGKVVRTNSRPEIESWGIAIDLLHAYNP